MTTFPPRPTKITLQHMLLTFLTLFPIAAYSFTTPILQAKPDTGTRSWIPSLASTNDDHDVSFLAKRTTATSTDIHCRRTILQQALSITIISQTPQSAFAASEKPQPILPLLTTAKRLRAVPLFTIVDGNGTPFHTYDKDSAGGFGYFSTSYASAEFVLDDAKKAFEKAKAEAANNKANQNAEGSIGNDGQDDVPDAWGQAQIVTLPLDVVMQLSVKKTSSVAQNGKGRTFDTYYQVIPSTVS